MRRFVASLASLSLLVTSTTTSVSASTPPPPWTEFTQVLNLVNWIEQYSSHIDMLMELTTENQSRQEALNHFYKHNTKLTLPQVLKLQATLLDSRKIFKLMKTNISDLQIDVIAKEIVSDDYATYLEGLDGPSLKSEYKSLNTKLHENLRAQLDIAKIPASTYFHTEDFIKEIRTRVQTENGEKQLMEMSARVNLMLAQEYNNFIKMYNNHLKANKGYDALQKGKNKVQTEQNSQFYKKDDSPSKPHKNKKLTDY